MSDAKREPLPDDVRQVLVARLAVARVTGGKAAALMRRVCADSRLRGWGVYHGAHTGRFSARGFQPHNLPRPVENIPADAWAPDAPALARKLDVPLAEVLGSMLRGLLVAPDGMQFAIVDYASIEARGLLWLAGDEHGLEVYRRFDAGDGADPYRVAAAGIYGVTVANVTKSDRLVGKIATLALGYQGGPGAFERMATAFGVDLSDLDVPGIVDAWRDAHPLVAGTRKGKWQTPDKRWVITRKGGLWRNLKAAAWATVEREPGTAGHVFGAGRCVFGMEGPHLIITLPSGRPLVYRRARIEEVDSRWGTRVEALTYASARGRVSTYGGKLCENITQAVCRDLLASALVELEAGRRSDVALGYIPRATTVLHIHDEIISEVRGAAGLAVVEAAMLNVPAWAAGLPVAVDGKLARRYTK